MILGPDAVSVIPQVYPAAGDRKPARFALVDIAHPRPVLPQAKMALNAGIAPLAILSVCLMMGAIAGIILTRKIARIRLLRELQLAAEAQLEAERLANAKPELVDVYIEQPKKYLVQDHAVLGWSDVLPLSTTLNVSLSSPHPHRTIEHKEGHSSQPFIDGNILEVSVGIAMPRPPSQHDLDIISPLESYEYCIGTSDTVVCTLLGARRRLLGLN